MRILFQGGAIFEANATVRKTCVSSVHALPLSSTMRNQMSPAHRDLTLESKACSKGSMEKGSIMVETAMTIPFFLITMIVIMKLAFFGYTVVAAQWIAQQVTREVLVQPGISGTARAAIIENRSEELADLLGVSQYLLPRVAGVHNGVRSCSFNPLVDMFALPNLSGLDRKDICGSLTSSSPPIANASAGDIGDIVVVQLRFHFGLFKYFPNMMDPNFIVTGESIGIIEDNIV